MRYNLPGLKKTYLLLCVLMLSAFAINGQTLTLYSFPPKHAYKWKSPHSLLISAIRNYYTKSGNYPRRILGHMVIELKKDSSTLLTGMTADEMTGLKSSIMKEKIGLGVLFKVVNGHLEESSQVQNELKLRIESSKTAFIQFNISDSAYNYLLAYIDSFKIKGYDKLYNGLNDPRAGKGCGCTAFGISLLELINALTPEYKDKWAVQVNVPQRLIGDGQQKKVSLWRLFFSFKWAKGRQPYQQLTLYEPSFIYKWINNRSNGARGLEVDCRTCLPVLPMFTR